jgi:hypothetical protein
MNAGMMMQLRLKTLLQPAILEKKPVADCNQFESATAADPEKVATNPDVIHGIFIAKVNQPINLMKIQNILFTVICSLSISATAQNAGSSGTTGSQLQGSGNNPVTPGTQSNGSMVANSENQHSNIGPGLNNPGYYYPNYNTNFNGRFNRRPNYGEPTNGTGSDAITNGFGSGAVTNGFGYGGITNRYGSGFATNGFGDRGIANGFGDYTNQGMIDEFGTNKLYDHDYTNRHRPHLPPFTTDPRVMGGNDLNNTND